MRLGAKRQMDLREKFLTISYNLIIKWIENTKKNLHECLEVKDFARFAFHYI